MFAALNNFLIAIVSRGRSEEAGQSMVEYGLILSLVAVAAVVAVGLLGTQVTAAFTSLVGTF